MTMFENQGHEQDHYSVGAGPADDGRSGSHHLEQHSEGESTTTGQATSAEYPEAERHLPPSMAATSSFQATALVENHHGGDVNALKVVNYLQDSLEHLEANDQYLELTRQLFAPPTGFDSALEKWRNDTHLLVVAREFDTGQVMIGHAFLAALRKWSGENVSVGALPFGGGTEFKASRLPLPEGWAYVVQVPPNEEDFKLSSSFGSSLAKLQDALKRKPCWMVMLMTPQQWLQASSQAPDGLLAQLGDAEPLDIAERALRVRDKGFPVERWLRTREISSLLNGQPPSEVQEVVDLMLKAQHADPSELIGRDDPTVAGDDDRRISGEALVDTGDRFFSRRVATVVAARRNWRRQLLDWHRADGRTSFQRNFLVSAAAQPGAPVAHVYAGTVRLAEALGEGKGQPLETQVHPGVIDLVDAAVADLTDKDTVEFDRVGWDDAVLEYFWVDRPLSRAKFLKWLAGTVVKPREQGALESLTESQRQELAARIAHLAVQWAVRQKRALPLEAVAETWRGKPVWQTFIATLDLAAVQPTSTGYLHEMLLRWAKSGEPARAQAVAEVCSREFGSKHTGKALRRLKHAAGSPDTDVIEAVQAAVLTLWRDASVRQALFAEVIAWCREPDTAAVGRRSFATLANAFDPAEPERPWLLVDESAGDAYTATESDLADGWNTLLNPAYGDVELEPTLSRWLDAGLALPHLQDIIVGVLARAAQVPEVAGQESERFRLTGLARKWCTADGENQAKEALYFRITRRLDDDFLRGRADDLQLGRT
ncbi:hypothetical protein ACWEOG_21875 [Amycolatopsis japonica]